MILLIDSRPSLVGPPGLKSLGGRPWILLQLALFNWSLNYLTMHAVDRLARTPASGSQVLHVRTTYELQLLLARPNFSFLLSSYKSRRTE